ncbi:hypothetical protein DXG01_016104 [Tephrocybe rancida]|nr:hypothetical protein DXG01_016104 [Tephrocybe rancida]
MTALPPSARTVATPTSLAISGAVGASPVSGDFNYYLEYLRNPRKLSEAETSQTLFIRPNGVQHWLKTYKSLAKALHDQVQTHIIDLQQLRGNYFQELIHGYIALTLTTPIVLTVDGLLSHAQSFIRRSVMECTRMQALSSSLHGTIP